MSDTHTDPVPAPPAAPPASDPPKDKPPGIFDRASMQGVLALGLLVVNAAMIFLLYFHAPPDGSGELLKPGVTIMFNLLSMAVAYYLGQQSATK